MKDRWRFWLVMTVFATLAPLLGCAASQVGTTPNPVNSRHPECDAGESMKQKAPIERKRPQAEAHGRLCFNRGDRTGFELFVEGIRLWTPETRFLLSVEP